MKLKALFLIGVAALLLGSASVALAQTDCSKLMPASPWGPNDQTGATNRVTPAVTKAAAGEIQTGQVVTMSYPLVDGVPLFGSRFTKTILTAVSLAPGAAYGENELTYMEDTWLSQSHVGTHLDGMGHIGRKDCYYNRTPMGKYINQNNMTRLGLEHLKSFATRGVVIDAVKVFQAAGKFKGNAACKKPCLDAGTVITAADLQAGLRMYNVTLREGDIVIVHTGWGDLFEQFPAQNATYNSGGSRDRQGRGQLARLAEDRRGRDRHVGRRGDSRGEPEGSFHRPQHPPHRQRHPHPRERPDRPDRGRGRQGQPGHVLLQHDGAEGGGAHRQLRRDRRHPLARPAVGGMAGASASLRGRRRLFSWSLAGAAAVLALAAWLAGAGAQERRYTVAFANLTEEPGVTLEGTGFTGRDVRQSFALAARQYPIDLVFYDNQRDDARARANAEDAIAQKVEPLRPLPSRSRYRGGHRREAPRGGYPPPRHQPAGRSGAALHRRQPRGRTDRR